MLQSRYAKYGAIIFILVILNIVVYIWDNWGLITVKVTDVPLRKVISSIEWQGWVKIYTNIPLDQKVTMFVDHVPLPEALETLAANVSGPGNGEEQARAARPDRANRTDGAPGGNQTAGGPPPGGQGGQGGGGPGGGGPGRGGFGRGGGGGFGGFGGGGGGGGASWNLAFFVAPSKAQAQAEITAFESGAALTSDDLKVYSYPTPLQMLMTDSDAPAADPRKQTWPGYKPPPPPPPPPADGSSDTAATTATPPPDPGPPTVQTYLQSFAESSDIWIMSNGTWAPLAPTAPPAGPSIVTAVENFVSSSHGSMIQAYVLRAGTGGPRARGGGFGGMDAMQDRIQNAINGLPPEDRDDAQTQLNQEMTFYKAVQAAPPEQKAAMFQDHMKETIANRINNNWRRSPEKRAQRFARAIANRAAATAAK